MKFVASKKNIEKESLRSFVIQKKQREANLMIKSVTRIILTASGEQLLMKAFNSWSAFTYERKAIRNELEMRIENNNNTQ